MRSIQLWRAVLISVTFCAILPIANGQNQGTCRTVSGDIGNCVPIRSCTIIVQLLTKFGTTPPQPVIDYIRKIHCGTSSAGPHVCCALREGTTAAANSLNSTGLGILNAIQCGQVHGDKISKGEVTTLSEFPWMTLLEYDTIQDNKFLCGGSLITDQYVLTAAHCVTGISTSVIGVRLGEHDLKNPVDCEKGGKGSKCAPPVEDVKINRVIVHPNYNKRLIVNDIALLRLERKVFFRSNIKAVCLPITDEQKNQKLDELLVSGWGTTENGTTSNVLLKATVKIRANSACQQVFWKSINMTSEQLCAGGSGNGVDTCKGDSGGPLFAIGPYRKVTRFIQFGVVSAGGSVCGDSRNFPGIYARVSSYMKWITDNIHL